MLLNQPIRQIAYFVDDVRATVERHHKLFGSGPYFIMEDLRVPITYRGHDIELSHTAAFGQWGSMQVEIMRWESSPRSVIQDFMPQGKTQSGFHHVAMLVDDLQATTADMNAAGFEEILRCPLQEWNMTAVFFDTMDAYGHFVEVYERVPPMVEFYDVVEKAARNFDGTDLFRDVPITSFRD